MNIIFLLLLPAQIDVSKSEYVNVSNQKTYNSLWQWSEKKDYHNSIVRVKAGASGGSGTLISSVFTKERQRGLVITADHITRGRALADVIFTDGYKTTGRIVKSDRQNDISAIAIFLDRDRDFIPISKTKPQKGEILEYCGYGGPADRLRHFLGRVLNYRNNSIDGETYFLNGDSGGAALYKNELVGVISGGYNIKPFGLGNWMAHYPGRTCNLESLSKVVYDVQCSPYGGYCQPQIQTQPQYFPPDQVSPITLPAPEVKPVQPPLEFKIGKVEEGDTANVKVKREENIVTFDFILPRGSDGLQGPPGPPGKDGKNAEVDYDKIADIINIAVLKALENTSDTAWTHLILIAPSDAEYWPRLQGVYFRAQDYYDKIRHTEPPDKIDIGPMPLLVAYAGGKAVNKWVGLREVEDALTNIVRGNYDEFIK